MDYGVFKRVLMRMKFPVAEAAIALGAPPAVSFDLNVDLECPHCGGMDAAVSAVEDAEIARCPQCQCEFSPRVESVSRRAIRKITERRERRVRQVMESQI